MRLDDALLFMYNKKTKGKLLQYKGDFYELHIPIKTKSCKDNLSHLTDCYHTNNEILYRNDSYEKILYIIYKLSQNHFKCIKESYIKIYNSETPSIIYIKDIPLSKWSTHTRKKKTKKSKSKRCKCK